MQIQPPDILEAFRDLADKSLDELEVLRRLVDHPGVCCPCCNQPVGPIGKFARTDDGQFIAVCRVAERGIAQVLGKPSFSRSTVSELLRAEYDSRINSRSRAQSLMEAFFPKMVNRETMKRLADAMRGVCT